jgi:recombination protein RecT
MMAQQQGSTALATKEIHALLDRKDVAIELRKALPKHLTPERLIRIAATAIQKSPQLKMCTPLSLLACVVECGQLGLEPDGVLGDVYLVPFKDRKSGTSKATIIVGYKGFMKLAFQTGDIYKITAHVVRKGERFSHSHGTDEQLEHIRTDHGEEKDDSTWTHVYACAYFRDGHKDFEVLERADVFKRRSRSAGYRGQKADSPWFTDPETMWKKSAIRALAGRLPKSTTDNRLARAVALDEMSDAGMLTATTTGFEISEDAISGNLIEDEKPIEEAKEVVEDKKPKGKKNDDPIDVKPTKADPVISKKTATDIYNRGTSNDWKIDDIRDWVKKEFGCSVQDLRESQLPRVIKAMEAGTD